MSQRPWLLYENNITEGSISASSESAASSFVDDNVADRKPFVTQWKPNALGDTHWITVDAGSGNTFAPDTICIIDHNLSTISAAGFGFTLQHSTDNIGWTDIHTTVVPADDTLTYATFDAVSGKRYWRILFENQSRGQTTEFMKVGYIAIGRRLIFTEGLQPGFEPLNEIPQMTNNVSNTGVFLGTNIKWIKRSISLRWDGNPGFSSDFFESDDINMDGFWSTTGRNGLPFFFAFDTDQQNPLFCMVQPGTAYSAAWGATKLRRGLNLSFDAYVE